jgi:hypothetical protein
LRFSVRRSSPALAIADIQEHLSKGFTKDGSSAVGAVRVITGCPDGGAVVVSDRAVWMVFANPALEAVAGHMRRL